MPARRSLRLLALLGIPLLAGCAGSLRPIPVDSTPPSDVDVKLWVTGSSNVRRFRCRATEANLQVDRTAGTGAQDLLGAGERAPWAVLRVPSSGLDCGIALMNQHLREALHADEAPVITFRLVRVARVRGDSPDSAAFRLVGSLHLAGRERPVEIVARTVRDASGRTVLEGSHDLDVREFGIEPPRRFLGLLRVRNRVTIHYTLALPNGA